MKNYPLYKIIKKKGAILFDLFHTLVNVTPSDGLSTSDILGVSKEAWYRELMEKTPGRLTGEMKDPAEIIRKMARAINPEIPENTIKKALEYRIAKFVHALVNAPDDTIKTLRKMKAMGKKIGLVSNAEVSEIEAWDSSPLAPLFDVAVFSCYAGVKKPESRIYEICMDSLGAAPSECVFVGDGGSNELEGAKKLGITTVMVTGFIKDMRKEEMSERKKHADFVIEKISGLTAQD